MIVLSSMITGILLNFEPSLMLYKLQKNNILNSSSSIRTKNYKAGTVIDFQYESEKNWCAILKYCCI